MFLNDFVKKVHTSQLLTELLTFGILKFDALTFSTACRDEFYKAHSRLLVE